MAQFRIVVLASGSGSLFQALIDQQTKHGGQIVGLITDKECPAISRAQSAQIESKIIELSGERSDWDKTLTQAITAFKPDLIISAGFMRILGPEVLANFEGRIINTHPALLPNFPGAHAVHDALVAGVEETGSTIHFVDSGIDTGQIIRQQAIAIKINDSEASLHERIKEVERKLLVDVVCDFVSGKIELNPRG